MLPTSERKLKKKFSAVIHDLELKIKWYLGEIEFRDARIEMLKTKVLTLEAKVRLYRRTTLLVLVLGIMLYLIF